MLVRLAIVLCAICALLAIAYSSYAEQIPHKNGNHKKAVNVIAPVGGAIWHKLPAMGRMPSQKDWGPEAGLFYGRFTRRSHLIIFPYWADVNGSRVWGGVSHLEYYFPASKWVEPMLGVGFDVTRVDIKNAMANDIQVFAPWFKLGMRVNTPVKGLWFTPYTAYLFQGVDMGRSERIYNSAVFGINVYYHFNRVLQTTFKYYYRYTHDGRNGHVGRIRIIARLHKNFGLYVRSEYAKQIYDEYINILAGPAFIF